MIGNKYKNVVCEGSSKMFLCLVGKMISVNVASYGRYDGITCSYSAILNWNCYVINLFEKVKKMCEGKIFCMVMVSYGIFGDFCVGMYKYLSVDYECIDSKIAFACES